MAAGRHNLSRRAVLGACVGVPALLGAGGAPAADLRDRWTRALAGIRRSEARLAALPPGASDDLFGDLECARLDALRRLLYAPAPDPAALALKVELTVDDQAWELTGAEPCLAALKADARRPLHGG